MGDELPKDKTFVESGASLKSSFKRDTSYKSRESLVRTEGYPLYQVAGRGRRRKLKS